MSNEIEGQQQDTKKVSRRNVLKAAVAAGGAAALGFPMIAKAQQTITFKMQSTWPTKDIFHDIFVAWGKKVEEMAGGRLKVDILPAPPLLPAFPPRDAVPTRTLHRGHGCAAAYF